MRDRKRRRSKTKNIENENEKRVFRFRSAFSISHKIGPYYCSIFSSALHCSVHRISSRRGLGISVLGYSFTSAPQYVINFLKDRRHIYHFHGMFKAYLILPYLTLSQRCEDYYHRAYGDSWREANIMISRLVSLGHDSLIFEILVVDHIRISSSFLVRFTHKYGNNIRVTMLTPRRLLLKVTLFFL